jgi:hypothetical protein
MPLICERCYAPLGTGKFIRLGHIRDVRPDGEPIYAWAYLHNYDADTDSCVGAETSADAA